MSENKALEMGPLERVFKGSAMAKILDFLVTFKAWDYSKSDIAKNSGVNFRTVLRELPHLEELGVVEQTRNVGRAKMYQLNQESPIAQLFDQICMKIAMTDAQKQITKKERIKMPA